MGILDGKVALVTGASRGIGADIARRFAAEGASVALTARTTETGQSPFEGTLLETAATIERAGGKAVPIAADLSRPDERERIVEETRRQLGDPDILVNNAAVTYFLEMATFPRRRIDLMFEVQVHAPVDLAQRVVPRMRERGAGWILNISSSAARHPQGPPFRGNAEIGGTVYGMCKAAIERFSTGLAAELWADHIAVNALSPAGLVPTPGARHHHLHELVPKEQHEAPEVMAEAALALCSGNPRELTGRISYSQPLLDELGRAARPL
jgi:NAD(P)-dependent dehydrogenase (short-subunit alcohol dehydrogenase family)